MAALGAGLGARRVGLQLCRRRHRRSNRPVTLSHALPALVHSSDFDASSDAHSTQPLTVPTGLLIFNDIRLRGFWLTGGYAKVSSLLLRRLV